MLGFRDELRKIDRRTESKLDLPDPIRARFATAEKVAPATADRQNLLITDAMEKSGRPEAVETASGAVPKGQGQAQRREEDRYPPSRSNKPTEGNLASFHTRSMKRTRERVRKLTEGRAVERMPEKPIMTDANRYQE